MVRQLQKISRLMERGKEDHEKIEQWKQSLTYQSEILNRQKMEMDARIEQIEQMEAEFEYLERQRQELDGLKQRLSEQQRRLEEGQVNLDSSLHLAPEQKQFIQSLAERLANNHNGDNSPLQSLNFTLETVQGQQTLLNSHWQNLEEQRKEVEHRQAENEQLFNHLEQRARELQMTRSSLETAKIQLQIQETVITQKQELFEQLNLNLQSTDETRQMLIQIAQGEDINFGGKIDLEVLRTMPLEELEVVVNNLQKDLERLGAFVNDQEEELTLQSQTVTELQAQIAQANESEKANLAEELAEEEERKGMLTETLVGQRRNLRERQAILSQHLKILQRRQGTLSVEDAQKCDFEPVLILLSGNYQNTLEDSQRLEAEIAQLRSHLQQTRDGVDSQWSEIAQKTREFEELDRQWREANLELVRLKAQVQQYENILQPVQDRLDEIRRKLETLSHWFTPQSTNGSNNYQAVN
jgi:chromosome segregation ATPase